jgi:hypothetical protein
MRACGCSASSSVSRAAASMKHGEPSGCVAQSRHSYLFIIEGGRRYPAIWRLSFAFRRAVTRYDESVNSLYPRRATGGPGPAPRRRARARGGRRPRPRAGRGTASAPDRSRYAPSRSRTREASAGARGPGARRSSHAGKLYIYRTSTPTVANHGAARRYLSSTATGSPLRHWSSFSRYAFLASISPSIRSSMSGPRWPPLRRGAGGVGGRGQWRADAPRQCRMHRPGVPRRSRHRAASACGFLPCHGGSPVRVPYRNRHGADRSALGFRR